MNLLKLWLMRTRIRSALARAIALEILGITLLVVLYCITRPCRWLAISMTKLADGVDAVARILAKPVIKWVRL